MRKREPVTRRVRAIDDMALVKQRELERRREARRLAASRDQVAIELYRAEKLKRAARERAKIEDIRAALARVDARLAGRTDAPGKRHRMVQRSRSGTGGNDR